MTCFCACGIAFVVCITVNSCRCPACYATRHLFAMQFTGEEAAHLAWTRDRSDRFQYFYMEHAELDWLCPRDHRLCDTRRPSASATPLLTPASSGPPSPRLYVDGSVDPCPDMRPIAAGEILFRQFTRFQQHVADAVPYTHYGPSVRGESVFRASPFDSLDFNEHSGMGLRISRPWFERHEGVGWFRA